MSREIETNEGIIRQLPPEVSNKIAAGEVVQRPGSVVKELLDNAIDSGADQIKVIVQNAGRTLIQVIDNGSGIGRSDIPLAFLRHATSKIYEVDDLFRIRTMGFRGEALASIASVAQVTLKTKRIEDEAGFEYEIWGGEEKSMAPTAVDNGTSIAVGNLFYNVPARRAFLKTDATEFRHILLAFQQAALAHTEIGFELLADTDKVYNLPVQSLAQRITDIFGKSYKASLIPVEENTSYMSVKGYLIDPNLAKKTRGEQFLFVNNRPFYHRHLSYIIQNLYKQWIRSNEYPFFALFFEVDPSEVDINVHPSKLEVKFGDERSMSALTKSIIRKALNEHLQVPIIDDKYSNGNDFMQGQNFKSDFESDFSFKNPGQGNTFQPNNSSVRIPSRINFKSGSTKSPSFTEFLYGEAPKNDVDAGNKFGKKNEGQDSKLKHDKGRGFWQLHDRYIISQTLSGLFIVDQHAAHKRILYEKALQSAESGLPSTQQLLFPQTIDFSATDYTLLKELMPIIKKMGFNIQLLSGNTAIISGVPSEIRMGDEREVLDSILQQYQELSVKLKLDAHKKVALAFASKTAMPRGRKLSDVEMETLIDQLFACENPYFDPLNKPTIFYIPLEEIASRFR